MENYYHLLDVSVNSSINEIIMSYQNKITKFNNIKKLNNNQIKEIKQLKAGLYILTDDNLRTKYNSFINKKFNYSEPSAPNQDDMNADLRRVYADYLGEQGRTMEEKAERDIADKIDELIAEEGNSQGALER